MEFNYGFIMENKTLKFSFANTGNIILDIGCGAGAYCSRLQRRGRIAIGIDTSRKLLNDAKRRGVEVCLADAQYLPFKENFFDSVLCFQTLEHVNDDVKVIKEIARVTSEGILITVPNASEPWFFKHFGITYQHYKDNSHRRTYTVGSLITLLESANIRVTEIKTFAWSFSLKGAFLSAILYLLGVRPAILVKGIVNKDVKI